MGKFSELSDYQLLQMAKVPPSAYSNDYLLHLQSMPKGAPFDKTRWGQPTDTRKFANVDPSMAQAQRQVGSSTIGVLMPNNPYQKEAEQAALQNVYSFVTDPTAAITTFHGSPTSGIRKFDMNFRGTGEGRLAPDSPQRESFKDMIAHGLYTAENQGIAKGYQERLANSGIDSLSNHLIFQQPELYSEVRQRLLASGDFGKEVGGYTMKNAIDNALMGAEPILENALGKELIEKIKLADQSRTLKNGSTYTTELLPSPDEYLHWDKPLSEQPLQVKEKLAGMADKSRLQPTADPETFLVDGKYHLTKTNKGWKPFNQYDGTPLGATFSTPENALLGLTDDMRGNQLYSTFSQTHGSDKAASEYLDSLGIKGVKYLDGGNRGTLDQREAALRLAKKYLAMDVVKNNPEQFAVWQDKLAKAENDLQGIHNYVTFRPETESIITHENGQRIPGAVEDAYKKMRDPASKSLFEKQYPELINMNKETP